MTPLGLLLSLLDRDRLSKLDLMERYRLSQLDLVIFDLSELGLVDRRRLPHPQLGQAVDGQSFPQLGLVILDDHDHHKSHYNTYS